MKKTLLCVIAILGFQVMMAQMPVRRSVNAELLGSYNLFGISFDSRFKADGKFGYKIGLGYGMEKSTYSMGAMYEFGRKNASFRTSPVGYLRGLRLQNVLSVPVQAYYLMGKNKSFFEVGVGVVPYYATFAIKEFNGVNYYGLTNLAYRYEAEKWTLSTGIDIPFKTPGSDFTQTIGLYPKLSIGYRL